MDERALIESAKQNKHALSLLLSKHQKMVFGFLLQLTCDRNLAEDLTQDTFVKAIVNIKKFRHDSKFSTWLFAIANNIYLNHKKRHSKLTFTALEDVFSSTVDIEKLIIVEHDFHRVMNILNQMKDNQRTPFLLKHYYGYHYDEIAIITNCPIGTVRSRIHNTIKKLQKELGGYHDLP